MVSGYQRKEITQVTVEETSMVLPYMHKKTLNNNHLAALAVKDRLVLRVQKENREMME